jgi:teichuronic acid biosynthesis glycosyltransferase TuaC
MKVLIVCGGNGPGDVPFNFRINQAFIYEQIEALKENFSVAYDTFFITGHGVRGYLQNLPALKRKIREYGPDIVHAHFATSGLLAVLQRLKPVIVTYHGSDINDPKIRLLSAMIMLFSKRSIFVSDKLRQKSIVRFALRSSVIPCGINFSIFYPIERSAAREALNWSVSDKIALFCSSFNNPVKNSALAKAAIESFPGTLLMEIKNRSREEVNLMLNAADLLLLTSFSEGSPQIIKEAMATNCPVVATDVGDIRSLTGSTEGCFITTFAIADLVEKMRLALAFGQRTMGRDCVTNLDNKIIAQKIFELYKQTVKARITS